MLILNRNNKNTKYISLKSAETWKSWFKNQHNILNNPSLMSLTRSIHCNKSAIRVHVGGWHPNGQSGQIVSREEFFPAAWTRVWKLASLLWAMYFYLFWIKTKPARMSSICSYCIYIIHNSKIFMCPQIGIALEFVQLQPCSQPKISLQTYYTFGDEEFSLFSQLQIISIAY